MGHALLCSLGCFLLCTPFYGHAEASKPRATLMSEDTVIPAEGSVTLICFVDISDGWKFDWFRRGLVYSLTQTIRHNEPSGVIRVSDGGLYSCRGKQGDPEFYSETSNKITIQKIFSIKASLTLQPSWSQIYSGESVTLRCQIQGGRGGGGAQWTYEWTPTRLNNPPTSSEYRIIRAADSHSGDYSCRGRSGYLLTVWSDVIKLTVSPVKPKTTLTALAAVPPAGGSVTLTCSVDGSADWRFDWFRSESESSAAPLIRENEAGGVMTVSEGGVYSCRGGRGDPVLYTEYSNDVIVQKTLSESSPVLLMVGPVIGLILIILLLLLWRYRRSKGFFCTRPSESESSKQQSDTNQDMDQTKSHVYSSLQHDGDASLYQPIKPPKDSAKDADKSPNVKLLMKELKHSEKFGKLGEPEEDAVYCNVEINTEGLYIITPLDHRIWF